MEEINLSFLSDALTKVNIKTNTEFIKKLMIKFITNDEKTTFDLALKNIKPADFIEKNVAIFNSVRFFIFYNVGYDYTKLLKVERFFYRFLYVAYELRIIKGSYSNDDDYYTAHFKKLFAESNAFARKKMTFPMIAKNEEKINGFFNTLNKTVIEPSRLSRHKYKDEVKEVDELVTATQKKINAAEQQQIKLRKAIENLFQEHSADEKTAKYIINKLKVGTYLKYEKDTTTVSRVGGKSKRRTYRRRITGGDGTYGIVNYLEFYDTYFIKKEPTLKKLANGRYEVPKITDCTDDIKFTMSILPELKNKATKASSNSNGDLSKFMIAFNNNLAVKAAAKVLENSEAVAAADAAAKAAADAAAKADEATDKVVPFIELIIPPLNFENTLKSKRFIFHIIKAKYDQHPMVILNKNLV